MMRFSTSVFTLTLGLAFSGMAMAGPHGYSGSRSYSPSYRSSSYSSYRPSSYSYHYNGYHNYGYNRYASYGYNRYSGYRYSNYYRTYGTRFAYGYYYPGKYHYHWSYYCWSPSYGCNVYYDPSCSSWYYWCAPASCYYPVSYCPYNTYSWSGQYGVAAETPVDGATTQAVQPVESEQQPPLPPPVTGKKVTPDSQPSQIPPIPGPSAVTKPTIKKVTSVQAITGGSDEHNHHEEEDGK